MEDERLPNPDREGTPVAQADANAGAPAPPDGPTEPSAPDAAQASPPPADGDATEAPPTRREMKLVVTLRPNAGAGYRAVLALGADGCDPLLRAADVGDLQAALDEVPALLAEAEARWVEQPRNPAARPAGSTRSAAKRAPAPSASPTAAKPADASAHPTRATGPGQLSLFG